MKSRTQTNPMKLKPVSKAGIFVMVFMLVQMMLLFVFSYAGGTTDNPTAVFIGGKGNFPYTSMRNALHAAGFELDVRDEPGEITGKSVLILQGDEQFGAVSSYADNENVLGFVLICPSFEGNEAMDGLNVYYPECDIAIFAGKDKTSGLSDISDARLIYERLSGDDTIFGVPSQKGGILGSSSYFNNAQNRYLSIAGYRVKDSGKFMFSPFFQSELAGYLNATFYQEVSRDFSFSRINAWYIFTILSAAFFVAGMFIYLIPLKSIQPKDRTNSKKINIKLPMLIVSAGLSLATAVFSVVPVARPFTAAFIYLVPCIFTAAGAVLRMAGHSATKDDLRLLGAGGLKRAVRPLYMTVSVTAFLLLCGLLIGDLGYCSENLLPKIILVPVFMIDMFSYSLIVASDGRIDIGGRLVFVLSLVPSIMMLAAGVFFADNTLTYAGIGSLMCILASYLSVKPMRTHTSIPLFTGIMHAAAYVVVAMVMM